MMFAICWTETVTIKNILFVMTGINVYFNVSFLTFNQYFKWEKVILGIVCKFFVPDS